jgi:hypothetical protein
MGATTILLTVASRHTINEPNIEAGYARFANLAAQEIGLDAFSDAVAGCVHDGLIGEPVRLPEGALQCHGHLELTPKGVAAARKWLSLRTSQRSIQEPGILC